MEWLQLLPSSFSSGLTRYSAVHFFQLPRFSDLGKTGMVGKGTLSRPSLLLDMSCSSWIEDLFEGRRWEGVKSAHDGFRGYREEGACLANLDLAKYSLCFCLAPLPWAKAVATQLCCLLWPPTLSSLCFSSYLTVSTALHSHAPSCSPQPGRVPEGLLTLTPYRLRALPPYRLRIASVPRATTVLPNGGSEILWFYCFLL